MPRVLSLPTFAWGKRDAPQIVRGRKPGDRFVRLPSRPHQSTSGFRRLLVRLLPAR